MDILHIWHICAHIIPTYESQIFVIYDTCASFGGHICFKCVFGNNRLSRTCSLLYLGTYMQKLLGIYTHLAMLTMSAVFEMWQPYMFSDICQMGVQCSLINMKGIMIDVTLVQRVINNSYNIN